METLELAKQHLKSFLEHSQNPEFADYSRPVESLRLAFELLFPEATLAPVISAPKVLDEARLKPLQETVEQALLDLQSDQVPEDLQQKLEGVYEGLMSTQEAR